MYRVRLFLTLAVAVTLVLLAAYAGYRFYFFRPPPEPAGQPVLRREPMPSLSGLTEATPIKVRAKCADTMWVILGQAFDDPTHPSDEIYAVLAYWIGDGKTKPFAVLVADTAKPQEPPMTYFDFDRDGFVDLKGYAGSVSIGEDACDQVWQAR